MLRYFCFILLLISCSDNKSTVRNSVGKDDSLHIRPTNNRFSSSKSVRLFDNQKPFKLLLTGNRIERNTSDKDTVKCANWTLTSNQVSTIIKNSEPIDGTVWDLAFDFLSCAVYGTIIQDNVEYPFSVNAGSYALINSGDTTIIYGDYQKKDNKYFLSSPQE
jgi:hypothetical protein